MKTYVRISDGVVSEVITASQDINSMFHSEFVSTLVDVTDTTPIPAQFWLATSTDGVWSFQDSSTVAIVKTSDEIKALRLIAYREQSDNLKLDAEFTAISTGKTADYTAWLAKVAEIKALYPLPE
jgi:hypothetical protein